MVDVFSSSSNFVSMFQNSTGGSSTISCTLQDCTFLVAEYTMSLAIFFSSMGCFEGNFSLKVEVHKLLFWVLPDMNSCFFYLAPERIARMATEAAIYCSVSS